MSNHTQIHSLKSVPSVESVNALTSSDLNDLCDATDEAIEAGGGFGWLHLPSREILERYWQGVVTMQARLLFVARLDGVICGTATLVLPTNNNEAQSHAAQLTANFIVPWARGQGLSKMLLTKVESNARERRIKVINLDVRESQKAAIKLYESAGYTQCGAHPYYAEVDAQPVAGRYYYKILSEEYSRSKVL